MIVVDVVVVVVVVVVVDTPLLLTPPFPVVDAHLTALPLSMTPFSSYLTMYAHFYQKPGLVVDTLPVDDAFALSTTRWGGTFFIETNKV